MLGILKLFWRAIGVVLLFFGILWFPKDLLDTSEALKPWRELIATVDQLTAFKVFAGVLTVWVVWADFRPFVLKGIKSFWSNDAGEIRRREIIFQSTIKERIELAKRIDALFKKGPLIFRTREKLYAEFAKLESDSDIFLGIGELPHMIAMLRASFSGAYAAHKEGKNAGLTKDKVEEIISFFGTASHVSNIFACRWLQGEDNVFDEFENLMTNWENYNAKRLGPSLRKLGKHCGVETDPSHSVATGVIFRRPPWVSKTVTKKKP